MSATKIGLLKRITKYKQYLIGLGLLASGIILIVVSLLPSVGVRTADYSKEGGFTLAATGLAFLIAELALRRESEDLLKEIIESTLQRNLEPLRGSIGIIEATLDELKQIREKIIGHAVSDVLEAKFATAGIHDPELQATLRSIVDHLCKLGSSRHWAKDVYRDYLAAVIRNTSENTLSLSELAKGSTSSSDGRGIKMVPPSRRTDEILSKLMAKMGEGSQYSVLSDVESWLDGKLENFFRESVQAAKRGVFIRRVFIVSGDDIRRGVLAPEAICDEINRHLAEQSSSDNTGYHVRVYDTSSTPERRKKEPLEKEHFGIFRPAHQGDSIHVRVEKTNLSTLRLTNLPRVSDEQTEFDTIWADLKDFTTTDLKKARQRWQGLAPPRQGNVIA